MFRLGSPVLEVAFAAVRTDAARLLAPKAVQARLHRCTLDDEAALREWLVRIKGELRDKLAEGPVVLL